MDAGATDPGVLLQTLAARAAITDVLHAYCRIFDANDLDALDEVFTDDCIVMFRPGADHERHGLDELRSYYASGAGRIAACSHHLSNIEIQLHGDAAADSRAYFYAWHRYSPDHGGGGGETWGQYVDSLVRQPGGWRIVSRQSSSPDRPRQASASRRHDEKSARAAATGDQCDSSQRFCGRFLPGANERCADPSSLETDLSGASPISHRVRRAGRDSRLQVHALFRRPRPAVPSPR